ncbi:Flavonoid 3'-monooxygenase [Sesamum alatum]|uniref:Flavonoid 3'-monooxygenase n=1 Tax=Sesamum alatum TaxID=300844 RepID=A0AAE2CI28_9LAMI|nr:Flavonoid 3'-monooxygenase [Sesamum alatum]
MDPFATIALLATVFILSITWILPKTSKEAPNHPLPPGPRGLPIVGYLPFLHQNLHLQFTELARQYGPIYKFKLGNKLCVVISSPSLVKEVVRDHDAIFANRDAPVAALIASYGGNDVVWTDYDSHWRMMRKIFSREMLSNSNIEGSYHLRRGEVRRAVRDVYSKIGTPVDVGQVAFFIELNVIMSMIWGSTVDGAERERIGMAYWGVVSKLVDLLGKPNVSDYFPGLARFDVQGIEKEMKGYVKCVDRIVDDVLKERIAMTDNGKFDEGKKDFLQTLLDLKERRNAEISIDMTELRALLMYAPFGSGRRVCAGVALAERTLMYILASLLHSFEWRLANGEDVDMTEKLGLVLRKSTSLIAIPTPRLRGEGLYV